MFGHIVKFSAFRPLTASPSRVCVRAYVCVWVCMCVCQAIAADVPRSFFPESPWRRHSKV